MYNQVPQRQIITINVIITTNFASVLQKKKKEKRKKQYQAT